jgi:2-iminobutanoate/2-iminopropanoate deaminase
MTRSSALFCLLMLSTGSAAVADAPDVEHLNSGRVLPQGLPFSEAVRVGNSLYLSGQIGVKPGTLEVVEGGMPAQARQTLENIKTTLEAHGYGMDDVVKCTVMLLDMSEWGAFNEIYISYFSPPYPARSAFGASGLAAGALLELECIAAVGSTPSAAGRASADGPR